MIILQLLSGAFGFNMAFGTSPKYSRFECDFFELPKKIQFADCQIKNERHFIEFLLRNKWIQHRLGIDMPASNGFFPDVKGFIRDKHEQISIKVEVEYRAENYANHGHEFKGCDLILSFVRSLQIKFVKGVPVWSFYQAFPKDDHGILCLTSDINYDFLKHEENEEKAAKKRFTEISKAYIKKRNKKGDVLRECPNCGKYFISKHSEFCSIHCWDKYSQKYT